MRVRPRFAMAWWAPLVPAIVLADASLVTWREGRTWLAFVLAAAVVLLVFAAGCLVPRSRH